MSTPDSAGQLAPLGRDRLIEIAGTVQGIGFRPLIARLAAQLGLRGWVRNDPRGVTVRITGDAAVLDQFVAQLRADLPAAGRISTLVQRATPATDANAEPAAGFVIIESDAGGAPVAAVTPDLALCVDCRAELLDPHDRRHRYPFINCTNCGPRYTILQELPYDRPRTTMGGFVMCPTCAREYADPGNRRFHAQPNACRECGPHVELQNRAGASLARRDEAITAAAAALRRGDIVAVKGIGGFHLFADATSEAAVTELRRRKHREEKPFAVMFESVDAVRAAAVLAEDEERWLISRAAPIVLVLRRPSAPLAGAVAPGNPWIGAFLAYAPLHVLLLAALGRPVVATSGNLAEEPLCIDNAEARERLEGIADLFLVHDRPIARPIDDSVLRPATGGPVVLRRARGFAPAPFALPDGLSASPLLCVGAHLKNTIAVTVGTNLVLSPHIGDLGSPVALAAFRRTIELFRSLHALDFQSVACDAHPDYASTRFAESLGVPVVPVQHHLAHILACLLEHGGGPDCVLGVAWDGTGYGSDGTIWGGEFIVINRHDRTARRVAHLQPFRLPGGEAAIREPRRIALAALHALFPAEPDRLLRAAVALGFMEPEAKLLASLLVRGLHAPVTTSAGRLFDGVAALLGLRTRSSFEGQAAMDVEAAAAHAPAECGGWPMPVREREGGGSLELDWRPALAALVEERDRTSAALLSGRFHVTLAAGIVEVARRADIETVVLTGGCFQNVRLLELTSAKLQAKGFTVLRHRDLPPNDGGIAAGQALGALWGITAVAC